MKALRHLIQEIISNSTKQTKSEYFGFDQQKLDELSKVLLEMFGRRGEWLFAPNDPEVMELRKRFGIPVEYIGGGSYRITFSIGNDLVLKISTDSLGEGPWDPSADQMNQDDWTLGTDTSIRNIVPRAYDNAADWSWVVLERVAPLENEEDFFNSFRTDLLPDPMTLSESGREDYVNLIRILLEMKNYKLYRPLRQEDTLKSYFLGSEIVKKSPDPDVSLLEIRRNLMRSSPAFKGLALALNLYNIRVSEIRADNVGIGSDGRLVLLDSSIFPPD